MGMKKCICVKPIKSTFGIFWNSIVEAFEQIHTFYRYNKFPQYPSYNDKSINQQNVYVHRMKNNLFQKPNLILAQYSDVNNSKDATRTQRQGLHRYIVRRLYFEFIF